MASVNTQAWFGGQVQKIVSTSATLATAEFNRLRPEVDELALFDGRTHHLDGAEGVLEYVRWRQADAMKNSVGMLASPVTFWHKGDQAFRTLDVQRNAWTPVAAPYFDTVETLGLA